MLLLTKIVDMHLYVMDIQIMIIFILIGDGVGTIMDFFTLIT